MPPERTNARTFGVVSERLGQHLQSDVKAKLRSPAHGRPRVLRPSGSTQTRRLQTRRALRVGLVLHVRQLAPRRLAGDTPEFVAQRHPSRGPRLLIPFDIPM